MFGHLQQPYTDLSTGSKSLYTWIYTFHMPAFILISGFFAKGSTEPKYIKNLINLTRQAQIIILILLTIDIVYLLSHWRMKNLFEPLIELKLKTNPK